jgi:hypothetical protein
LVLFYVFSLSETVMAADDALRAVISGLDCHRSLQTDPPRVTSN